LLEYLPVGAVTVGLVSVEKVVAELALAFSELEEVEISTPTSLLVLVSASDTAAEVELAGVMEDPDEADWAAEEADEDAPSDDPTDDPVDDIPAGVKSLAVCP
jgi:hypothetical protein